MATLIKLRRKKSSGNNGVTLAAGEAYYNLADKHLFVGNSENEEVTSKKHIAQITPIEKGSNTIAFQIGEDSSNLYEKTIDAGTLSGSIENAKNASNVTASIGGVAISTLFNVSNGKPISIKNATTATKATYASDSTTQTIGERFTAVNSAITDITNGTTTVKNATNAANATNADDLTNLSLSKSKGATITLSWGTNKSSSFTVTASSISGTMDNAANVTSSINGNAISDIFETNGKTVKNATNATKLTTARTIKTNLSATTAASFDGSANVTVGVEGTLPIARGGTGATTAAGILSNMGIHTTIAELDYVHGVTSDIQTQLNSKSATTHTHSEYALTTHNHDTTYAAKSHNHDSSYAAKSHTHSYAGSATAGGAATSANKLNTNAGSSSVPVYFSNGIPVACSGTLNLTATSANKLATARTITLTGDVTGSVSFNGSSNVSITTTVNKAPAMTWSSF